MIEPNKVQLGTGHTFFTKIIDKAEHKVQHKIKGAQRGIEKLEKKNQKTGVNAPKEKQNPNINQRQFSEKTSDTPEPISSTPEPTTASNAPKQTAKPIPTVKKPKTGPRSGSGFNAGATKGSFSGPRVARETYKYPKGMNPSSK